MVNQQTTYRIQQKRDKKRKRRKRLLFLLLPVIIIGIAIGIYLTNLFQTAKGVLDDSYAADGRENGSALRDGGETIDLKQGVYPSYLLV
ncbi:hypothetical protein JCM21714_4369 [Gracilibacillus boraciitolerans JCM 21714]|uniref:Uncharacterized protein n=1 Tax=Gracilibacillus boraciitolerans JCM 21714 TaxID=1298598 RepID=W4VPM6_9BACI|nr:hypothetical protein JCM21714_4369 [Gracilibacillus boraciitolerans JCM 21714]